MTTRRAGFVLPAVIFALTLMAVIAMVGLQLAGDERRSTSAFRQTSFSEYAAEGGLRSVLGAWPAGAAALAGGDSLDLGWQSLGGGMTQRTVIHRMDANQLQSFLVITQGKNAGSRGGTSTVSAVVAGVPLYRYGIFTQGNITISSSGLTDGFDSGAAPYNAATRDSTGSIATNGSISLTGSATVYGDASAVGTVSGGTVTGTTSPGITPYPVQPNLTCPGGGYTPALSVPTGAGITYNALTGALTVSGGNTITLAVPPTQYYFSSITLSGGSILQFNNPLNQHIDIYASATVNLSGGGLVNAANRADLLSLLACGASATTWTLSGGSSAYFAVYAPAHPITMSGGSPLYGALIGASLTNSGGSAIHYDAALSRAPSNVRATVVGSWAQMR